MTPKNRTASALVRLLKKVARLRDKAAAEFNTACRELFASGPGKNLRYNDPMYPEHVKEVLPAGATIRSIKYIVLAVQVIADADWYTIGSVKEIDYSTKGDERKEYWLSLRDHYSEELCHKEDIDKPWLPEIARWVRKLDPKSYFLQTEKQSGPIQEIVEVPKRVKAEADWSKIVRQLYGFDPRQQAAISDLAKKHEFMCTQQNRKRIIINHIAALLSGLSREKYPELFSFHHHARRQLTVRIDGEVFFWDRTGHLTWEEESQDVYVPGDERAVYKYENWYPRVQLQGKKKTRAEKRADKKLEELRKKAKTEEIRAAKAKLSSRKSRNQQRMEEAEAKRQRRMRKETTNEEQGGDRDGR